tara:strand:+ start:727 stop:927 length:201 start_codon:yes stop_codon:yes gene_type:complete
MQEEILTAIHDLNTFMTTKDNETYLSGKNENGEDVTIIFSTIELLEWLNIKYMEKQAIKYIQNLQN